MRKKKKKKNKTESHRPYSAYLVVMSRKLTSKWNAGRKGLAGDVGARLSVAEGRGTPRAGRERCGIECCERECDGLYLGPTA
ncbi:hypothetical protein GCM10020220_021420 [Nonomuraea rubra]